VTDNTAQRRTPGDVWREMRLGNERFVRGEPLHPRQDVERRAEVAREQRPIAALFGCSDSRLAAEIIFDKGLGDLFVVRNAGQVMSDSVLGSLEYAVAILGVSIILVLAHDECGAVRAAIESQAEDSTPLPPHIAHITDAIVPAVRRVAHCDGPVNPTQIDATAVGREHLRDTIGELLNSSEMMSMAVADGTLAIVGANYRLREGRVDVDVVVGTIEP
jgi:carbonic anhydrase